EYKITPFRKYKLRLEKTERRYLTEKELVWIEKYPAIKDSRMELHKNMFVFAAYTGGLRISDILKLQWKDFDGTHLNVVIRKTGVQLSIKIPDKGMKIIERYKPNPLKRNSFVFPMLRDGININALLLWRCYENPTETLHNICNSCRRPCQNGFYCFYNCNLDCGS